MLPKRLEETLKFLRTAPRPTEKQIELLHELEIISNLIDLVIKGDKSRQEFAMENLQESFSLVTKAWGGSPGSCPTCGQ